jgi:hypothetical protein
MQQLYGIVELDPYIVCSKAVLGSSEPIVIGGISGRLELPHPPDWSLPGENPIRNPLRPPDAARTWKQGEQPMCWGRPVSYPTCDAHVEKMLLRFDLPEHELASSATLVHCAYTNWWLLFNDYLEVITRQRRSQNLQISQNAGNFDLFRWGPDGKADRPYTKDPSQIIIRLSSEETLLTPAQLTRIASFASASMELSMELKIQLESYRALRIGDYRKAIIETAVSAELALTSMVRSAFLSSNISYGDKLLEKFRMLGGRFELARIIGVPLPQLDFMAQLVDPRNQVIHRADFADERIATLAVMATDKLLLLLWPSLWEKT